MQGTTLLLTAVICQLKPACQLYQHIHRFKLLQYIISDWVTLTPISYRQWVYKKTDIFLWHNVGLKGFGDKTLNVATIFVYTIVYKKLRRSIWFVKYTIDGLFPIQFFHGSLTMALWYFWSPRVFCHNICVFGHIYQSNKYILYCHH